MTQSLVTILSGFDVNNFISFSLLSHMTRAKPMTMRKETTNLTPDYDL